MCPPEVVKMVNRHTQKKNSKKSTSKKKFYFSLFIYFWDNITKLLAKQFEIERPKIIID